MLKGVCLAGLLIGGLLGHELVGGPVERSDDDLMIFTLLWNDYILSDGLIVYGHEQGILLPLGEMCKALRFAIEIDRDTASGWFLQENRTFFLDVSDQHLEVEGKKLPFQGERIEWQLDDIFVDSSLLANWFPIELHIDYALQVLTLSSSEQLPLERQLAREEERALKMKRKVSFQSEYPREPVPYAKLRTPFLDLNMNLSYSRNNGNEFTSGDFAVTGAGEMAFLSSAFSLRGRFSSSGSPELTGSRLQLGRQSLEGGLLGLDLSSYQIGEISAPGLSEVMAAGIMSGVVLSNFPLDRPEAFDHITLEGDLNPDWEVELYHNTVFLDYRLASENARYRFEQVPLLYGSNHFRLVFHGPQGQRREQSYRYDIDSRFLRPGRTFYRMVTGVPLIPSLNATGLSDRYHLNMERGFSPHLSMQAHLMSYEFEDQSKRFASIGLLGSRWGTLSQLRLVAASDGGWMARVAAQTRKWGLNFKAEHTHYQNFVSELKRDLESQHIESALEVDGSMALGSRSLAYHFSGSHEEGLMKTSKVRSRLSTTLGRMSLTHALNWTRLVRPEKTVLTNTSGSFLASGRLRGVGLRSQLNYLLEDGVILKNAGLSLAHRFDKLNVRANLEKKLDQEQNWTGTLKMSKKMQMARLGLSLKYEEQKGWDLGFSASTSLGRDPRSGRWVTAANPMTTETALSARVFIDDNLNGRFDKGEKPLENIGIRINGQDTERKTQADGLVFIKGLRPQQRLAVSVMEKDITDPFLISVKAGASLLLRSGVVGTVDFPIVPTGEIEGRVVLVRNDRELPAANVQVQLMDETGRVIKEVRTEFDGLYLMEQLPPGKYLVGISSEQMKRLNMASVMEHEANLNRGGQLISDLDFRLTR